MDYDKEYIGREDNHFSLFSCMPRVKVASKAIKAATDKLAEKKLATGFWNEKLALRVGRAINKNTHFGAADTASREAWYSYVERVHGIEIPYEEEIFSRCCDLAYAEEKK